MKKLVLFFIVFVSCSLSVVAQRFQSDHYFIEAEEALENDDYQKALDNVNMFIDDYPKLSDGYMLRGIINYYRKKNGDALSDFNVAIMLWKKNSRYYKAAPYFWRAYVYQTLELYDKALQDYETACKLFLKSDKTQLHDVLYNRAQLYYDLGRYAEADEDYKLMLKYDEANIVAMIGLARNMIARKEYVDAIELLNKCQKFDVDFYDTYLFRMKAYGGLGEDDKAIDDAIIYFEKKDKPSYSSIAPYLKKHLSYSLAKVNSKIKTIYDNKKWKLLRISIYEWNKDWVNAINAYNEFEKEYGSSQSIYFDRSSCFFEIGDCEMAIKDITSNIENGDGTDHVLFNRRGLYYFNAEQYDLAIEDYSKEIELSPTSMVGYCARGYCYEFNGDYDKALEDYNAGIDVDESYQLYLRRGRLRLKMNEQLLAKADFEEVLKRDTIAEIVSCRHLALHFLGRDEEALAWMEKIIEAETDFVDRAYYDKVRLLSLMGRVDEAIATFRIAFEKGYRNFILISHNRDIDIIRNHPDFIELIDKYSTQMKKLVEAGNLDRDSIAVISEIGIKKMYSGVYEVPCNVNGLPLNFIFDIGASTVSISSLEVSFMLKNGYLKQEDIEGKEYFSTATGEIREGTIIRLREIKIGDAILRNVKASVAHNQQAPLLLGQSVLERFGIITIDNINSKLFIKQ